MLASTIQQPNNHKKTSNHTPTTIRRGCAKTIKHTKTHPPQHPDTTTQHGHRAGRCILRCSRPLSRSQTTTPHHQTTPPTQEDGPMAGFSVLKPRHSPRRPASAGCTGGWSDSSEPQQCVVDVPLAKQHHHRPAHSRRHSCQQPAGAGCVCSLERR